MFSEPQLTLLAESSGFLKRKRKVTPRSFINTLMFHAFAGNDISLTDHVIDMKKHEDILIKKQSLHQRFTKESVDFVKNLVARQCKTKLVDQSMKQEILPQWDNVYLHDSCQFGMPDYMRSYFNGYGGGINNNSVIKVQHCFELKSGKLHHHQVGDAHYQDATSGKELLSSYQQGDLVLRDLGYFDLESFKLMDQECKANYISRLKPKTSIFDLNGCKLDMAKLGRKMKKNKMAHMDRRVIIGTKKPAEVRIIITLAPEAVKQERIRKANKQNKSYGNQTSKTYRQYAAFNIFITNVSEDILNAHQVMKLYRVRWQIELVFKTWKSHYKLHCIKTCNCYRTLCYLYACLLLILINLEIYFCFQSLGYIVKKKTLSILKLMKAGLQYKDRQRKWSYYPSSRIFDDLWEMFTTMVHHTVREKRKNRYNYGEILALIS